MEKENINESNGTIDIDSIVATLESKRSQFNAAIDTAIASLRVVWTADPNSLALQNQPIAKAHSQEITIHSATFHNMSVVDAAIKYLRMAKKEKTFEEIFESITKGGVDATAQSARTLMNRRAREKIDLVKFGRGKFGLKEWS